ncbi:hypothetical protein HELRODRAFT_69371, partial [Helobdella robusta]|uniref:Tubulin--tyrosine ligase-like protein 9 n=1 Tax=Helobdella robusta TaxID=6412 RepID=T1FZU0_HELRO
MFYQFSSYRTQLGELKHDDANADDSDVDYYDDTTLTTAANTAALITSAANYHAYTTTTNLTKLNISDRLSTNRLKLSKKVVEEDEKCLPWVEDDGYYGYLYRLVNKHKPTLFWGSRRDFFNQKLLNSDQIINHFTRTVFTTKVGLSNHLRDLHWYQPNSCYTFYPRSYQLAQPGDKIAFEQDFCLTAAISLLKIILSNNLNPEKFVAADDQKTKIFTLSDEVYHEACAICQDYLKFISHDDLDEEEFEEFSSTKYTQFLKIYDSMKRSDLIVTVENYQEKSEFIMYLLDKLRESLPQFDIDGTRNIWILKPGAKSRGRGIKLLDGLTEIMKLVDSQIGLNERKYVIQKYIERPLLICKTKFDIRQWFLVTGWNPLTVWFYRDSYIRFCSQQFTLDDFEVSIHLSNNSIQKHYTNEKTRSKELPGNNMWTCHNLKNYMQMNGAPEGVWDQIIFQGMKDAVISSLLCCQEIVEHRKNTFELFGADFMLSEDYQPWLIEINSSPCMAPSTSVTACMCPQVLEDTLKVVLDLKIDKTANTGLFQLAFKQNQVQIPSFFGSNFQVDGQTMTKP